MIIQDIALKSQPNIKIWVKKHQQKSELNFVKNTTKNVSASVQIIILF